jgi:HJR/Mrr/RecB family endonuclease
VSTRTSNRAIELAAPLFLGATKTIDILAPLPDPEYPKTAAEVARDLLELTDRRLRVRLLIATAMTPVASSGQVVPASELAAKAAIWFKSEWLQNVGWTVKYKFQMQPREAFAIVDGELGIWISSTCRSSRVSCNIVRGAENVAALRRQFELHWENPWIFLESMRGYRQLVATLPQIGGDELVILANKTWSHVISELNKKPEDMFKLRPRQFEELIAHLLEKRGFTVAITPQTRDGGKDVLVATQTDLGDLLYLVECKRYRLTNPVDVRLVRELYGVVEQEKATAGLLMTTSYFTKAALSFREQIKHRMTLHDYDVLIRWLQEYGPHSS